MTSRNDATLDAIMPPKHYAALYAALQAGGPPLRAALDHLMEACRAEGRADLEAEQTAMLFVVPDGLDLAAFKEAWSIVRSGGATIRLHEPVVRPWTRTAAAQVRDLQEANTRFEQDSRTCRQALALIADMTDPERSDNYRADDREGCLDAVYDLSKRGGRA